MSDEAAKVHRLSIQTADGIEARVQCPRRGVDVSVTDCTACDHCVGLSLRDSYLICSWQGTHVVRMQDADGARWTKGLHFVHSPDPAAASERAACTPSPLGRFERAVVTATLDDTVLDVARRMRDQKVGCVVVIRDGHPVGILTDRDIVLRIVAERLDPDAVLVSSIVTYDAVTIARTDGFETAVRAMREHGVRRVPIVDADGRVTGIVTADDLVALLGSELSSLGDAIASNVDGSESR
jgi:CBS domain-containing protein